MLFQHLDLLNCGDLLLMDCGYPCRWLVAVLNQRGIGFCMRVEKAGNAGFAWVRDFLRSDLGGIDQWLVPTGMYPCWTHDKKRGCSRNPFFFANTLTLIMRHFFS